MSSSKVEPEINFDNGYKYVDFFVGWEGQQAVPLSDIIIIALKEFPTLAFSDLELSIMQEGTIVLCKVVERGG